MTDTLIDRADSGDIHRIDDLGIEQTRDLRDRLRRRDTTSELTQNLAHEIAGLPPRRRPDSDQTAKTVLIEAPLGLSTGDLAPYWDIEPDSTVTFGVVYQAAATIEGELRPAAPGPFPVPLPPTPPPGPNPKLRKSVPYAIPANAKPWTRARHAKRAPRWAWVAIGAGLIVLAGAYAGLVLAATVVFW